MSSGLQGEKGAPFDYEAMHFYFLRAHLHGLKSSRISLCSYISHKMDLLARSFFWWLAITGVLAKSKIEGADEIKTLNNLRDKKRKYLCSTKHTL